MTKPKQDRPASQLCTWCGKSFCPKNYKQACCSQGCRVAYENSKTGRHTCGPCPTCSVTFHSRVKGKIFCSLECYMNSEQFKQMSMENIASVTPKLGVPRTCQGCGGDFPRSQRKKYCSDRCRRRFFAERFDRWIASPESVALPQNFDEFLLREQLPCPISGCNWEGEHLGNHVNFAHGITARQFKKLCGFNLSTGLIGDRLARWFSDRTAGFIEQGIIKIGSDSPLFGAHLNGCRSDYVSLESKEHRKKSVADRPRSSVKLKPCRECGADVAQPYCGRREYCSTSCRSRYYARTQTCDCVCAQCGTSFVGSRGQSKRHMSGLSVCCSVACRNRMNVVAALSARGISR